MGLQKLLPDSFNIMLDNIVEQVKFSRARRNAYYMLTEDIDLSVAGTKVIRNFGNLLYVKSASDYICNVTAIFNRNTSNTSDILTLRKGMKVKHPFDEVYLTWTAQGAGKTLKLLIGNLNPEFFDFHDDAGCCDNTRSLNGNTGTQIIKNCALTNNATAIIHTVTAGKKMYLTDYDLSFISAIAAINAGAGSIKVRNTADVDQYTLSYLNAGVNLIEYSTGRKTATLNYSIIIPAGYDIVATADTRIYISARITGWEENA